MSRGRAPGVVGMSACEEGVSDGGVRESRHLGWAIFRVLLVLVQPSIALAAGMFYSFCVCVWGRYT